MRSRLFVNIKGLAGTQQVPRLKTGAQMDDLSMIENAYLLVEDGKIASFGAMEQMPQDLRVMAQGSILQSGEVTDATGRYVIPTFCDSHTHLVYAGSREQEFTDKIKGLSYQEIARRGG